MLLVLALCPTLGQADPYGEFKSRVRGSLIKPFALDLGGLLGASSFSSGRSLGMPGFEAGALGAVQSKPNKDDLILRNAGVDVFGLPLLYAGVGLPFNVDVVAHGMKAQGVSVMGGGLRYGIFQSSLLTKFLPSVGVSGFVDQVTHSAFKATHLGANLCAGWDLPLITPFLGVGLDSTKLTVREATVPGVLDLSDTAKGSRFTAGAEITPFPFVRLRGAYLLLHGVSGGLLSLGAQF